MPADAPSVAALRLTWAAEWGDPLESPESYAAGLAEWIEAHAGTVIGKIAESDDGDVVGMGWLAIVDRVPVPTRHDRRSGDIQSVFVQPGLRGTGIGRAIIDALVDEGRALGLGRIVLHASAEGIGFYRRIGWSNSERLLEHPF